MSFVAWLLGLAVWGLAVKVIALWTLSGVLNVTIFYPLFLKFIARSRMGSDDIMWITIFGPLTTVFCILAYITKTLYLGLDLLDVVPNIINRLYRLEK